MDVSSEQVNALKIAPGSRIVLRDPRDEAPLAIITGTMTAILLMHPTDCIPVDDVYTPDKVVEATKVFGDNDLAHPAVSYLHNQAKDRYVGGNLQAIQPPTHFDYVALRCLSSPTSGYQLLIPYSYACRIARTL